MHYLNTLFVPLYITTQAATKVTLPTAITANANLTVNTTSCFFFGHWTPTTIVY